MKKLIIALVAILLLAGGVAYASIPGADGTIHGCYKTSNPATGAVIVIDSEDVCPSGFTLLNWNQTGPSGADGQDGADGVSSYEVVANSVTNPSPTATTASATADCPAGKVATGGGGNGPLLQVSRPVISDGVAVGWTVQVREQDLSSSAPITANVWAICAEVAI